MRQAKIIVITSVVLIFSAIMFPNADGLSPAFSTMINGTQIEVFGMTSVEKITPKFLIWDKPISLFFDHYNWDNVDLDTKISITDPEGKTSEFDVQMISGLIEFLYPIEVNSTKGIYQFSFESGGNGSFEILSLNNLPENYWGPTECLSILEKYNQHADLLKNPLTEISDTPRNQGTYQQFEGGVIYSKNSCAFEVHGLIGAKWIELGAEYSYLGFPITDELDVPIDGGKYSAFEQGIICWSAPDGEWVVTVLEDSTNPQQCNQSQADVNNVIPEWVRNIFIWYGQNQVSETELLEAIKFLINQEIIILDSKPNDKEQCELDGGSWELVNTIPPYTDSCNPATSDAGKECISTTQCESYCQAPEDAEIGSQATGTCYGYKHALCMQEVFEGKVNHMWCK